MKKTTKNILFYTILISFAIFGFGIFAQEEVDNADNNIEVEEKEEVDAEEEVVEAEEIDELRERLDMISQKTQELMSVLKEEGVEDISFEAPKEEEREEVHCELYLKDYIKYGANNDSSQVEKLQVFLNDYLHEDIPVTGTYGEATRELVNRFQMKHASEILHPWGITEPTGYVYKTTQRKINDIKCPETTLPIPVVDGQIVVEKEEVDAEEEKEETEEREIYEEDTEFPLEEGEEETEDVDEDKEDKEDKEDDEDKEEDKEDEERNTLAWVVIILGSLGIGMILHRIYGKKPDDKQRV